MASFSPETITHVGFLPITNTLIHTLFVDGVLIAISVYVSKNTKQIPSFFQNMMEGLMEVGYNLTKSIAQKTHEYIFPFAMSFFLFIFVANITSLFPGFGSIGFFETKKHLVPLLRGATSDLNVTLALAVVSIIATHALSIKLTGIKNYLGRFFSLNPILLFVGILEIVAEITKVISLSFRLFGNIYAGEVALMTVSGLFAFLFPLPFLFLENIVALVQAFVFSILTLVFMAILTTPHHLSHGTSRHVVREVSSS